MYLFKTRHADSDSVLSKIKLLNMDAVTIEPTMLHSQWICINQNLNQLLGDLSNLTFTKVLILLANKREESKRVNLKRLEENDAVL